MKNFQITQDEKSIRVTGKGITPILRDILFSIDHSQRKHPEFVENVADAMIALGEEVGEAQQALLQAKYEGCDPANLRKELLHVITVAMRTILNLNETPGFEVQERKKQTKEGLFGDIKPPLVSYVFDPAKPGCDKTAIGFYDLQNNLYRHLVYDEPLNADNAKKFEHWVKDAPGVYEPLQGTETEKTCDIKEKLIEANSGLKSGCTFEFALLAALGNKVTVPLSELVGIGRLINRIGKSLRYEYVADGFFAIELL